MKIYLSMILSLICLACDGYAQQATITLNNYDMDKPVYFRTYLSNTSLAPVDQVYVQLLGGPDANNLQPVVIAGTTQSLLSLSSPGYFDAGIGVIAGVEPMDTAVLQLRAWRYTDSYDKAVEKGSVQWSQLVGYWNDLAEPPTPPTGPVLNIPYELYIGSIPEPASLALLTFGTVLFVTSRRFGQNR